MPCEGASARRTLRGITVRYSLSPKCFSSSAATFCASVLRGSYMVRSRPSISSRGLRFSRTFFSVCTRSDRPSSA